MKHLMYVGIGLFVIFMLAIFASIFTGIVLMIIWISSVLPSWIFWLVAILAASYFIGSFLDEE